MHPRKSVKVPESLPLIEGHGKSRKIIVVFESRGNYMM